MCANIASLFRYAAEREATTDEVRAIWGKWRQAGFALELDELVDEFVKEEKEKEQQKEQRKEQRAGFLGAEEEEETVVPIPMEMPADDPVEPTPALEPVAPELEPV